MKWSGKKTLENGKSQNSTEAHFPGGPVVENLPASAGDIGSTPGLGDSTCCRINISQYTSNCLVRYFIKAASDNVSLPH